MRRGFETIDNTEKSLPRLASGRHAAQVHTLERNRNRAAQRVHRAVAALIDQACHAVTRSGERAFVAPRSAPATAGHTARPAPGATRRAPHRARPDPRSAATSSSRAHPPSSLPPSECLHTTSQQPTTPTSSCHVPPTNAPDQIAPRPRARSRRPPARPITHPHLHCKAKNSPISRRQLDLDLYPPPDPQPIPRVYFVITISYCIFITLNRASGRIPSGAISAARRQP